MLMSNFLKQNSGGDIRVYCSMTLIDVVINMLSTVVIAFAF
jgi:hypothetical protein